MGTNERKFFMAYVRDYLNRKGLATEYDEKNDMLTNSLGGYYFSTEYRYFASGGPIEEIAGKIWDRLQMMRNQELVIKNECIIPMLRNRWFVESKLREGRLLETDPDDPDMIVIETVSEHRDLYLLFACDYGSGFAFLRIRDIARLGLSRKKLADLASANLREKARGLVKERSMDVSMEEDWLFHCSVPDNLAPSLMLVFDEVEDYIREKTGIDGGKPLYLAPLSSDWLAVFKIEPKDEIRIFEYLESVDWESLANPFITNPAVFWGNDSGFLELLRDKDGALTIAHIMNKGKGLV